MNPGRSILIPSRKVIPKTTIGNAVTSVSPNEFELKEPSFGYSKEVPLCVLCLRDSVHFDNQIIKCKGQCGHTFHTECITILLNHLISTDQSLKVNPDYKKCVDCNLNHRRCFQCCKLADTKHYSETVRCSIDGCLRHYHSRCLKKGIYRKYCTINYAKGSGICPSHTCYSCQLENPFNVRPAESYVRCVMCPTSFHRGEWCIPAGSYEINSSYIVCPQHLHGGGNSDKWKPPYMDFIEDRRGDVNRNYYEVPYSHDNRDLIWILDKSELKNEDRPTWCFKCSKGGQLIYCKKCLASYHISCANISKVPENYVCPECDLGKFPRYGEVLWVKSSGFRWWPAQVIHPSNATAAALRSPHNKGQFLVLFFGTNYFRWTNKTRAFAFKKGDDEESPSKGERCDCKGDKCIEETYCSGLIDAGQVYIQRSTRLLKLVEEDAKPYIPGNPYQEIQDTRDSTCVVCRESNCDSSCSFAHCPREFHRACVNGDVDRWRSWICPCHYCVECGKSAVAKCAFCVASYCGPHLGNWLNKSIWGASYVCSKDWAMLGVEFFG